MKNYFFIITIFNFGFVIISSTVVLVTLLQLQPNESPALQIYLLTGLNVLFTILGYKSIKRYKNIGK